MFRSQNGSANSVTILEKKVNRRDFIAAAAAIGGISPLPTLGTAKAQQVGGAELYELRRYYLLPGAKQRAFNEYLQNGAIPAMNRLGISPVGAFSVMYGENENSLYLLVPHPSFDSIVTLRVRMLADAEYRRVGAGVIDAPLSDPAFASVESSLLRSIPAIPKLEPPVLAQNSQPRILELRTYETTGEAKGQRLMEYVDAGWLPIFRKVGLTPVFFGETVSGRQLPSLQYILVFRDITEREAAWAAFRNDPDWRVLSTNPRFAETIESISALILRPTAYSQI